MAIEEYEYFNIQTLQNYSGWQLKNTGTSTSGLYKTTVDGNRRIRVLQHLDSTKLQWMAIEEYGYFNIWTLQNYSGWQQQNMDVQEL